MNRDRFNEDVRPHITAVKIGMRGVGFDRTELDSWAEANFKKEKSSNKQGNGTTTAWHCQWPLTPGNDESPMDTTNVNHRRFAQRGPCKR